jgi:hypothetical protein
LWTHRDVLTSVSSLLATLPTDGPVPPILPPVDGFLFLDREKFPASFAGDVPAPEAAFMANSQVPWGVEALGGTISDPAWRHKPSWYLHVLRLAWDARDPTKAGGHLSVCPRGQFRPS